MGEGLLTDVIIRAKNGYDKTQRLIESLEPVRSRLRIFLVDDGSDARYVADWADYVIRHNDCQGAVSATNSGLAMSLLHDDTPFVMVMDNDCWAPDGDVGWLDRMVSEIERYGEITACVGATSAYVNDPQHILHPTPTYTADWDNGERRGVKMAPSINLFVSFCCMMRKSAVRIVGNWDERFNPGQWEDTDYALQLRAAGYEVRVAQSVYFHHEGHSTFGPNVTALLRTNQQKIAEKWGLGRLADMGLVEPAEAERIFGALK